MTAAPWWKGAVVYHIYVRSFCDSNGDGYGDLPGVRSKLDYIQSLGVDAIWLSPIHPSPNRDWGYDVSDYEGVHPDYGNLADLDALIADAHGRGIKVMLDEVLAHTSDDHAWFAESRDGGPNGPKADWYVWADPADDGTAANNWLSVFGGPAWSYQPARRQHYHHKFLRQQPKLNWLNSDAQEAALKVLDFWLARGVDGFRLDVAGCFLHDAALRDNPAIPAPQRERHHWSHAGDMQQHLFDSNLPENIPLLDVVRRRVDAHNGQNGGDRFVFGEFSEEEERCGAYCSPQEGLHSAYTFVLLKARKLQAKAFREHLQTLEQYPDHWPCISFCNHDITRTVSRFGGTEAVARLMFILLLSLKGATLIYQGEELGLPEGQSLTRTQLRDPVGDLYWPVAKGRDGARTPMPWTEDDSAPSWLPRAIEHKGMSAETQDADPNSMLAFSRKMIALRKASPALTRGEITVIDTPEPILAFTRTEGAETLLCVFNMSAEEAMFADKRMSSGTRLEPWTGEMTMTGERLALSPHAAAIFRIS